MLNGKCFVIYFHIVVNDVEWYCIECILGAALRYVTDSNAFLHLRHHWHAGILFFSLLSFLN